MDRPHHRLFVKAPQVFQAAAAAADHQDVRRLGQGVRQADAPHQVLRRALALDFGGNDQHLDAAPAAPQHFQEIADGRAGGTGHECDPPREPRQGPLAARIEQAFGGQPLVQLAERQLQRADAQRLDLADDQLVHAARRINVDVPAADNLLAVLQIETQPRRDAPPDDAAHCAFSSFRVR